MTLAEHDDFMIQAQLKQLATQGAIVFGIHSYWGMVQPLIISSLMAAYKMIGSDAFKVHILGQVSQALFKTKTCRQSSKSIYGVLG